MGKPDPTRDPLPPPFPVGTRLRCIEGYDAYAAHVERPRDIEAHPEDWARVSGRGIEVTIERVEPGRRGTGRRLRDEDGPMSDDDGEPMLDETKDGYSVYCVVRGTGNAAKMSGRCIDPGSAHRWQVMPLSFCVRCGVRVEVADDTPGCPHCHFDTVVTTTGDPGFVVETGDFIKEGIDLGLVLASGAKAFDVIWIGGSTTRYKHGVRDIRIVPAAEIDANSRDHLTREADAARRERRAGARIRRGTVSPRR